MQEKKLTEQESLKLISEMISTAKNNFHERGTSAILWGSVVAVCGLVNFAELYWKFSIGFDIWILTLVAFVPQIIISVKEGRRRQAISHTEAVLNTIWIVYGISIFALVFYGNVVTNVTDRLLAAEGRRIWETGANGQPLPFHYFIASYGSLLLMLYAIPTLVTGLTRKHRFMIFGAILCYLFFIISCFVPTAYDMLLNGLAGIFNWLIPGILLRRMYVKKAVNV